MEKAPMEFHRGLERSWLPECAGLLTASRTPKSGSGSSISERMATKAPRCRTTANKPSKSPSGSRQYRHEFSTGNPQSARHHG